MPSHQTPTPGLVLDLKVPAAFAGQLFSTVLGTVTCTCVAVPVPLSLVLSLVLV